MLAANPIAAAETWLDVDTANLTLAVMDGGVVSHTYEGIAIGRNGTTVAKQQGDQKTPLGTYRIRRIKTDSRFHLFLGLDYPNMDQATEALKARRISSTEWQAINLAHLQGREPPASTALGGYIGIHGIGSGDPSIHEAFNWTEGCIALTNAQIDDLARRIKSGTRVVIR
jgi:murein L,D-transpeptidase YafK